ncbi:MAG TPA: DUF969 domain-containing protein [Candidatus Didemnitutus sp.]|nr:DUF969 domain-containing protein [Candidatus Didemnitutus sp.]
MIKLIGILVVAVGFGLRINTLVVVLAAGFATGWAAGLPLAQVVELFGRSFVENRYMTLPVVLMVPLIGLLERNGLQERAVALIKQARAATAGRVILLYALARQISVALGLNIGSSGGAHAGFVRPLVAPMAEAAAKTAGGGAGDLPEKTRELIRANAAAAENTGNFFGEDIFIAVGAILLMKGYFDGQKIEVNVMALALWGIPTAVIASLVLVWRTRALDRRIARGLAEANDRKTPGKLSEPRKENAP